MIELNTKYRPGKRTFMYLCLTGAWWLIAIGAALLYCAFEMYLGSWHDATVQFLAQHPAWYIDDTMVSQWVLLAGISFLFVAYLRTSVMYRAYSFYVDEHALHLRRGVIRVQDITIPYQQITNIHIEQPYHWRLLGLAQFDVTISNSRTPILRRQRDFLIPCIDKSLGKELSHFLTKEASGSDEEDEDDFEEEEDGEDVEIIDR